MIGTETGCWFSIKELPDGRVDFQFFRCDDLVDEGIADSIDDMHLRFDALDRAAALPLQ